MNWVNTNQIFWTCAMITPALTQVRPDPMHTMNMQNHTQPRKEGMFFAANTLSLYIEAETVFKLFWL